MSTAVNLAEAIRKPFGTVFADQMAIAEYRAGAWSEYRIQPYQNLELNPATHALHYASAIFEGLKAHPQQGGRAAFFRLDDHVRRMQRSADLLCLPAPGADMLTGMIRDLVDRCRDWIPESPGALYIRPAMIGSAVTIGAAAAPSHEALLYVILSPVGDYFAGGARPLRILLEDRQMRTAPHFGSAKTGGNYASALRPIVEARRAYQIDQVLFAPDGDVQETGAANFLMIDDRKVVTKNRDCTFLHGITRDSVLQLARELGYQVEERPISVEELLEWARAGEAALSGTAAVLSGIGVLIHEGREHVVGNGQIGANTNRLRQALLDIQSGRVADSHGWLSPV